MWNGSGPSLIRLLENVVVKKRMITTMTTKNMAKSENKLNLFRESTVRNHDNGITIRDAIMTIMNHRFCKTESSEIPAALRRDSE